MRKLILDSSLVDRSEINHGVAVESYRGSLPKNSRLIPRIPRQALKAPTGQMMPGRIMCVDKGATGEWTMPDMVMSPGGICLKVGEKFADQCYYAIVVRSGVFTHSSHVHMHPDALERMHKAFPLVAGTLILHTFARPHVDVQEEVKFITCDHLQAFWLPDEIWPENIQALREK